MSIGAGELTLIILLAAPIVLLQLGLAIYALVDLRKRPKMRGPRWLWALALVFTALTLPTGLIVSGFYLAWGRRVEEQNDPS
jgi:hypothetical protein